MSFRKSSKPEGQDATGDRATANVPERRRYQRILVDMEVDYRCEDTFLFAYITDLSALGIFVRTNNPEPPGTHLNLRFTLPGEAAPLEIEGEVIWINPFRPGDFDNINPGMGVRFLDLTKELKQSLLRLVRKIAYLEGDEAPDDEAEEGQDTVVVADSTEQAAATAADQSAELDADPPATIDSKNRN